MPLSVLADQPVHILPGGEITGWFVTMAVETTTRYTGSGKAVEESTLVFAPVDGYFTPFAVTVAEGFADAARAVYREKGFAATPWGFDERLLSYLNCGYRLVEKETIVDAVLTESALLMAVRYEDDTWTLQIETESDTLELIMPGPFRFSREYTVSNWSYAIAFVE